jgi:glycosyltransferase involved in cell wall biosynthesis
MLKVLFLTRYGRLGASSRYRFMQYEQVLRREGIECHFSPLLDDNYLATRYQGIKGGPLTFGASALRRLSKVLTARQYDVVVLEGEAMPYFPAILERFLSLVGVPYIVDFDDAIFHYYDKSPGRLIRILLGKKIATVVRKSACVFAGNDYLADYARRAGAKEIELVPTVIDFERYSVERFESGNFTVGWIGSPGSSRYLAAIAGALEVVGQDESTRLTLIGAGADFQLQGITTEMVSWSEETEVKCMQSFNVGIMPVPDDPWARGKCGLKLIQYMACGLPVVASPIGVNTEIVEHGINGFLAATDQEWVDALESLRTQPQLAKQMGEAGRAKVKEKYSLQVTGPQVAQALKKAAAK